MKLKKIAILAFPVALLACANVTEPAPAQGSFIEVQYVNYAWSHTYKGFVIDASGQVSSFDRDGKQWTPSDEQHPTKDELLAKYEKMQVVKTISNAGTLFSFANTAANGTVTQPKMRCNDAGVTTITAWLAQDDGKMKRVVIRMEGDFAQQNTSAAAKALAAEIDKLGLFPAGICGN